MHASQKSQPHMAVPVAQPLPDPINSQRLSDLETDKRRLQHETESLRQKYEQSEGARRALTNQLEELRSKVREIDDERYRAIRAAEEYRDSEKKSRKKQREVARLTEDENQRMQVSCLIMERNDHLRFIMKFTGH